MPKDKLTDYSATNASNTDVGGVNTDEGMLPSAVNNAIREVMTHLKNFASGTDGIDVLSLADDDASAAIKLQAPASVTADTTFTLPDGDGTDGQVLSTDGSGALSFVNTNPAPSLIINGDMAVWQRGTTIDTITSGEYLCDRWRLAHSGTDGNVDVDRSTDVPSGQGFAYSQKISMDASETSLDAADYVNLQTRFEGQNLQHLLKGTSSAKSFTVSFWVKSSVAETYTVNIYDNDNSRHISASYVINAADTWEKKTITFAGDTSGVLDNDNNRSLDLGFWLDAGTSWTSGTFATSWESYTQSNRVEGTTGWLESTSPEFYITGVKLEVGSVATSYPHESYAENELKCKRYYQKIADRDVTPADDVATISRFVANAYASTNAALQHHFEIEMRDAPTVTYFDVSIVSGKTAGWYNGAWRGADASSSQIYSNAVHIELANPSPTFSDTHSAYILQLNFVMDAEL
jgi:hypothetical protein